DLAHAVGLSPASTDADLLRRAFELWGDNAPAHILGDFAVAMRDERRLVLARDRFGLRPLYFVRGDGLKPVLHFCTNLADLVAAGEALDDDAVFDFLLFGQNENAATTTYKRIARVPPAHVVVIDDSGVRFRRYWSVPVADAPRRISERDAVEEFRAVFERAVADRAHAANRVAISLS